MRFTADDIDDEEDGVNLPELAPGVPPLIAAARASRTDVVSTLLTLPGLDVNARGEWGQTVLCEWQQDPRALHILDVDGIDVNASDSEGETALFYAFAKGDAAMMTNLVRKGIDLDVRNVYGVRLGCSNPLGSSHTRRQGHHSSSSQRRGRNIYCR
jgi:ankyrin repeat protein